MTITVLAGPPCAGKTTYAHEHAVAGDEVLDWDVLFAEISGLPLHVHPFEFQDDVAAAFERRLREIRQGWIIRCAPTRRHRAVLRHTSGGHSIVLATPAEICHERLRTSSRPESSKQQLHWAIDDWWQQYEPSTSDEEMVVAYER